MRRLIIAVPIVLVAAGAAAASWHYLRPRDPLAEARQLLAAGNLRAAQLVLRSAVQADPAPAETHMRLGQVQLRLGDGAAAEREFRAAAERGWDAAALRPMLAQAVAAQQRDEEVLRDYSADGLAPEQAAAVLVARAQAQLGLGRGEEAAASVAEAQRLAPKSIETALTAAKLAVARRDLDAARTHVGEALAIDAKSLEALRLQAELRAASGDREGALASYASAIDLAAAAGAPGAGEALRLGRAGLLVGMDEDSRARADLDVVLKAQPKQPVANFLAGRLAAKAGDWKAADAALAQVGPVLSRLPDGDLTFAVVKANLNQPEQAIAAVEHQISRTPDNLAARKLLAKLALRQQQPARAAEVLAASRQLDAEALDLLGDAYVATGQRELALEAARKASGLTPEDTRRLTRLAALQLGQGESAQAVQALGRVLDATPETIPATAEAAAPAPAAGQPQGAAKGPTQAQAAAALVQAALQAGEVDRAAAALERLRQMKADPLDLARLSGMVKLAQIDLEGARAAFEEARTLDPKAAGPRIDLARVLALQGRTAEATALLQEVLAADPANAAALTALVNLQVGAGQPEPALAAAEAARLKAPEDPGILGGLAALYLRTKQPDKTLALLDAAGKKAAGKAVDPGLLVLRAQALLALGRRPEAEQTLRALLERAPDDVLLRRQLAELLAGDKQYDDARALLREGLARRPGEPALLAAAVATAAAEGGPQAALTRADELSRDQPGLAAAMLKGDLLMSQNRYAEAEAAYRARLVGLPKDDPAVAPATIRAAEAVAAGGDSGRAASLLRDWLATHKDSMEATLALASLDLTGNRLGEARAGFETALARQPNNPAVLNNLAWIGQQQGDLPRARELAARAYLLGPTPATADTLGWIVLAQGHAADAVALLREAATGQPGDPAIQYHLAAALAAAGQKAEAARLLKAMLDKPGTEFSEKKQAAKLLAELAS